MTEDTRRFRSSEELAFANIGGGMPQSLPEDRYGAVTGDQRARIQREIAATMRDLVADCRRGPNGFNPTVRDASPTVTVSGAPVVKSGGSGWRDPGPLRPVATPLAEAVIEAMAHQALPHSPGNSAWRGPKKKGEG
jgi:hypothetical protein